MIKSLKVIAFILLSTGFLNVRAQETVEAIVAVVNEDVITLSDYRQQHDMLKQALRAQFQGDEYQSQYETAKQNLLERLITELLLLQEARRQQINVNEQINLMIENIKTDNGLTSDEQLKEAMRQQGINFDAWKLEMEKRFLREAIIYSEVARSIVIEDSEIVNYYRIHPDDFTEPSEYTIKAIYVSSEGKIQEEVEGKMKEIEGKLAAGEDFGEVAGTYSEGPERESQGDLGSFKKGELDRTLEEAVESLEVGAATTWLQTVNGWYLLQLTDRKESRLKTFEEVRDQIQQRLAQQQQQVKLEEYLEKIKTRSFIKIFIPNPSID
jgi:parvulin-like peptidyl-prolyl isomerase